MYSLLIKLMILAAIAELGLSFWDFESCQSIQSRNKIERASRSLLRIDWLPISVFPDEAARLQKLGKIHKSSDQGD